MPQANTSLGLPRPAATDRLADAWDHISDLADATNGLVVADRARLTNLESINAGARLTALEPDSGWVTAGFTPQAGWSFNKCRYRVLMGKFVFLEVEAVRTGVALNTPASGDMGNTAVTQIPAGGRPNPTKTGLFLVNSANAGGWYITSSGTLTLASYAPSQIIATNDVVYIQDTYMLNGI